MSQKLDTTIAVIGIDIGKNSFHVIGLDQRGANRRRQQRRLTAILAPNVAHGKGRIVVDAALLI